MKQIVRVLREFEDGPCTTEDISDATGLPKKHVAAYLSDLMRAGKVEHAARLPKTGKRGAGAWLYRRTA